ncbi:hypothetical protein HU200_028393 [Digitaria exilis]|uniref:Uncharacterized protein n=1 Tax=Digitaria exilis TaxID=1010633 RepID=A0A835C311_9POAL|nr:hypothetical protein HU200_028393 [Digitaria exilis]
MDLGTTHPAQPAVPTPPPLPAPPHPAGGRGRLGVASDPLASPPQNIAD